MDKRKRTALLGSLVGGSLIRVYELGGWVDFRGNLYSDAEVEEALNAGAAETLPAVRLAISEKEDMDAFIKGKLARKGTKGDTR